MIDRLVRQLKLAMSRQWVIRSRDIREAASKRHVTSLSPTEAFQAGARWAYWQGVSDMAAAEVAVSSEEAPEPFFH